MSQIEVTAVHSKTANTPPVFKELGGDEVGQLCRAWVNFNGVGTVSIRRSFNVSSITDNGTGDYDVNLINAMPTDQYAVVFGIVQGGMYATGQNTPPTTTVIRVGTYIGSTGSVNDTGYISVTAFSD